jgi:Rrf2 family protein
MKLSRMSTYALQAVAAMAQLPDDQPIASHLVARTNGIPERFLLKILLPLVKAGLLHSLKGPNGGYRLIKAPAKITVLEILEAVDGPLRGQVPAAQVKGQQALVAKLNEACQRITEQARRELGKVTVADLMKTRKEK